MVDNGREEEQRSAPAGQPNGLALTLYVAALVQPDGSESVCGPTAAMGICLPNLTTDRAEADELVRHMQSFANETGCTVRVLAFSARSVLSELHPNEQGAREAAAAEAEIDDESELDDDEAGGPDDPDRMPPSDPIGLR